jgi:hypothetical protein
VDNARNSPPPYYFNFSVAPIPATLTWPPLAPVLYGTPVYAAEQLNASANVDGSFSYSVADNTILDIGDNVINATFTPYSIDDGGGVISNILKVLINYITDANPISFLNYNYTAATGPSGPMYNPNPSEYLGVTYTTETPLFNFSSAAPAHSFYAEGLPPSLNIDYQGRVVGTPTINDVNKSYFVSVYAVGNIYYYNNEPTSHGFNSQPYNFILNLNPKNTPNITWTTPDPIIYGTPLGDGQLNASADVPGTFEYNPPAGTILSKLINTLSVTFTPTDIDYAKVTTSVNIHVLPSGGEITITGITPIQQTYASHTGATGSAGPNYNFLPSKYINNRNTYTDNNPLFSINTDVLASGFSIYGLPSSLSVNNNGKVVGTPSSTDLNKTYNLVAYAQNVTNFSAGFYFSISTQKGIPSISWENPQNIAYLTPLLLGAQLNAYSDVQGSFKYIPSPNKILPIDNNIPLTALFTPNGSDYAPTRKTTYINVVPKPSTPLVNITSVDLGVPYLAQRDGSYVKPDGTVKQMKIYDILPSEFLDHTFDAGRPFLIITTDEQPNGFTVTGLPPSLSVDDWGNVVGTPTEADLGSWRVLLIANNPVYNYQEIYITLNILKLTPKISWPWGAIQTVYGVPTFMQPSGAQAFVTLGNNDVYLDGNFVYDSDNTILYTYPGQYTWNVVFYPTNATNYYEAYSSTVINILP